MISPMRHFGKLWCAVLALTLWTGFNAGSSALACGCGWGGYRGYGTCYAGFGNRGYGWGGPGYRGYGWGGPGFANAGYGFPGSGLAYGSGYGSPGYGYGMGNGYPSYGPGAGNPNYGGGYSYVSRYVAPGGGYVAPDSGSAKMAQTSMQGRRLGINEEPVVDTNNQRGMKVTEVQPGTAAAKAGLQVGDVIHSINGYYTQQVGNLPWIIANAAPDNILKMDVRTARDGQSHTITAQLP
jgi:hypothetical protein